MKRFISLVLLSSLFLFSFCSFAKPVIKVSIVKGFKQRPVIAFPDSWNETDKSIDVKMLDNLIRNDLMLSGKTSLMMDREQINAAAKGEAFDKMKYENWEKLGIEFLVKIKISNDIGVPCVTYHIYDMTKKELIAENSLKGTKKNLRNLGHDAADDILMALTGSIGLGGTRIAFVSDKRGTKTIYSSDIQGEDIQQLVFDKAMVISPEWGMNRESIVYVSYQSINPGIFIKYMGTNNFEALAVFPGLNANPKLNNQNEMVFTASKDGNPEIYKKHLLTGKVDRLTRRNGVDASPCWSPDSKFIAFVSSGSGTPQIYIMDSDGNNVTRITNAGDYNSCPNFSPDGKYLAYSTRIKNKMCLALYNFQTGSNDIIVSHMKDAESPCFAPNSVNIAFSSNVDKNNWDIYIIDVETKKIFQVTKKFGNCTNPSWR
ncbi:MAG: hypothetical protein ACD_79C00256G0005 [uncultured bacterium]|nr:MAG: hypothetical protein ACD_79C00256G0005 [uncultured bacterium]